MATEENDLFLLRDGDWKIVEERVCRVTRLTPLAAKVEDDQVVEIGDKFTPYATIGLESDAWEGVASGAIVNRADFLNLWRAFQEKREHESVFIVWSLSRKHLLTRLISPLLTRLRVMVWDKDVFEYLKTLPPHEIPFKAARKSWPEIEL